MPSDRDDLAEYRLVRRAVPDATWDVIGTVLAVIATGVLLLLGVGLTSQGLASGAGTFDLLVASVGLALTAGGVALFLREFQLYPFD